MRYLLGVLITALSVPFVVLGAADFWSAATQMVDVVRESGMWSAQCTSHLQALGTGGFVWSVVGALGGFTLVLRNR